MRPADQHQDRIGLADLPGLPQDLGLGDDEANPWLEHSPEPDPPGQPVVESPDWLEDLAPDAGVPETPQDEVFWATVTSLRKQVAEALSKRLKSEALTHDQQRAVGRRLIDDAVTDLVDASISAGDSARWTSTYIHQVHAAVFDAQFGLGRLQPLVDDPGVENIKIYGHDRVYLMFSDGHTETGPPVARDDEELTEFLAHLADRDHDLDRSFTRNSPFLDLPLPGRARLAATGWVTASGRPEVTIRKQHLQDPTLKVLQRLGELDQVMAGFLAAAVRARCTIVVSGRGQGSGKTALLRALADEIPSWEPVATIETEPELFLHEDTENHPLVNSYLTRRGSPEKDASGRRIGEVTTLDIIPSALRHTISRVIVSEVRHHSELAAMFEAMQMGNGSMTTIHADSVTTLISRLVRMATYSTGNPEYAHREVGDLIDLAVYIGVRRDPDTGKAMRFVEEVSEIGYSPDAKSAIAHRIFAPAQDGSPAAVPDNIPSPALAGRLEEAGWNKGSFLAHPGADGGRS